jgi:hypothetical protein
MSPKSALGSTQPPIQWVPGVKRPGVNLTTHLQLVTRSRKCGSIHALHQTPSWRRGQLYLLRFTFYHSGICLEDWGTPQKASVKITRSVNSILISVQEGDELHTSVVFILTSRSPGIHWKGGWVSSRSKSWCGSEKQGPYRFLALCSLKFVIR